jgi:dolichol-phosphate mannosyltransferase
MVELSVVIPVYGCEDCLRALHRRLRESLEQVTSSYEVVLVDDRSRDGSWDVLRELAAADARVRAIRLSRNFGQHAAITAGLEASDARWTVVMDCDGQDPPEEIPRLYAKAREGYEVVYSRRKRRRQQLLRRVAGHVYFRLRNLLVGGEMHVNMTNLSIVSRKVVDAFLTVRDKDRQYLLILEWLGFEHTTIEVDQHERAAGRSSYSLGALLRVAVDGLFFDSTVLLRWIVYAGFVIASLGGLGAAGLLAYWATSGAPSEWALVSALVALLSGFAIVSAGVAGLYIGKIFDQVKGRPLYIVDDRIEGGEPAEPPALAPERGAPVSP